ncbi:MAG: glycosyltransferase [Myxococcales bacterium]|nr:glycosyltransferase [Myxococcales bacterium]
MAKVLCYTSPARGHLYPMVPVLSELRDRGHDVVLLTLGEEVERMAALGRFRVRPISSAIEAIPLDDYRARTTMGSLERAVATFATRAEHEVPDLRAALREERPDVVLVDFNSWGAMAVAEASSAPWAAFLPYLLPWPRPGIPPFGPGLAPRHDVIGKLRDALVGRVVSAVTNRGLPRLDAVRAKVGLGPLGAMSEHGRAAHRLLYFTAPPFEYEDSSPFERLVAVGPCAWEPPGERPAWLVAEERPVVLVTCSTELQADGALVQACLDGLAQEDVLVVATSGAIDPLSFRVPHNARVERFVPHTPVLERAACVVSHGGMGITQKALLAGVPVCVVPFGRDQHEVARRVEVARAGVRVDKAHLSPGRLQEAVRVVRGLRAGAARVAEGFRRAGGAARAAQEIESLVR